jgi:hypothetical protein
VEGTDVQPDVLRRVREPAVFLVVLGVVYIIARRWLM